ncbi:radical SAM/SPASM domain-containing protein [Clostridium sp. UBA5119]|uniref:radical SAM/SPASM domain-containing protein n=1 Tax=Clostridium sp. UBA5119 TaxID=1946366 RepID=UPI003217B395
MKIVDNVNAFLKISIEEVNPKNIEGVYLLRGKFNYKDNVINIVDFFNIDKFNNSDIHNELCINKYFLLKSMEEFKKNRWVYILINKYSNKTPNADIYNSTWTLMKEIADSIGCKLPLVRGRICDESINFEIYNNNEIILEKEFYTKFDEYDLSMWDLKILSNELYSKSAIYHKNTNSLTLVSRDNSSGIMELQNKFNDNKLTNLQKVAYEKFIYDHFPLDNQYKMISNENFVSTGTLNHIEFMIQLGCNLKCKYCYANEGTYGFSENIVFDEESAVEILNGIVNKGIHSVKEITFFGGEPSIYPKAIEAICKHCKSLYKDGHLKLIPIFNMVTNCVNMSNELIETIKKYEIKLTISLDGPEYINDKLRINKNDEGTYTLVYNNLMKMKESHIKPVLIESTYTNIHEENNISRQELINMLEEKFSIPVYLADCSSLKFKPRTCADINTDFINRIDNSILSSDNEKVDNLALKLIRKILVVLNNKELKNNIYCTAGYKAISVLGNGDYYPCHLFVGNKTYKIGNILNDESKLTFKNILQKSDMELCKKCWASEFCDECTYNIINNDISSCDERKIIIEHVILSYINLSTEDKKKLMDKCTNKNH